jgi:hypothetical protein
MNSINVNLARHLATLVRLTTRRHASHVINSQIFPFLMVIPVEMNALSVISRIVRLKDVKSVITPVRHA